MKLINYIRSFLSPRPVSVILSDANALVSELQRTAAAQEKRADRLQGQANDAFAESFKAARVAGKLEALLS